MSDSLQTSRKRPRRIMEDDNDQEGENEEELEESHYDPPPLGEESTSVVEPTDVEVNSTNNVLHMFVFTK